MKNPLLSLSFLRFFFFFRVFSLLFPSYCLCALLYLILEVGEAGTEEGGGIG